MGIDQERIRKFLNEIAAETLDLQSILGDRDEVILKDSRLLKCCKYSTIVIAEAIASTLQHILAKKHNVVIRGYVEAFVKAKECQVLSKDLLERLQTFVRFRNILVHRYFRVDDQLFLRNLRSGLDDFHVFVKEITENLHNNA